MNFKLIKKLGMKKVKIFLVLIMIAFTSHSVMSQSREQGAKIKSVTVTEEKPDMLVKKQYKDSETYYDTKGNITEEITFKDGKMNKHFRYQYDQDNNKIKEEELDSSGRIKETSEYKYSNGLRTEKIVYDSGKKIKSRKIYTYTTY
jgi:hypothetical protein